LLYVHVIYLLETKYIASISYSSHSSAHRMRQRLPLTLFLRKKLSPMQFITIYTEHIIHR